MDKVKFEKAEQNEIEELVNLRLAYLQEDFGEMEKEDFLRIKKMLPAYFNRHLNQDLFVYIARDYEKIVSCAFLLIVEKPMSPAFITGKTGTVLNVYTKDCDESQRLLPQSGQIEFRTTMKYLEMYCQKDMAVLDACAGGGISSFPLADSGCKVTAGDLIETNVEHIRMEKIICKRDI